MSAVSYVVRMRSSSDGTSVNRAIGARVAWYMKYVSEPRRTQAELAELLGIEQSAVSKKLTGRRPFFPHELYAIAEWLDRDLSDFLPVTVDAATVSPPPDSGPGPGRDTARYDSVVTGAYPATEATGRDTGLPAAPAVVAGFLVPNLLEVLGGVAGGPAAEAAA